MNVTAPAQPHRQGIHCALDAARRLALVERALHPANDCIDGFPIAL